MWFELKMRLILDDGTCVMKKVLIQNNEQLESVRPIVSMRIDLWMIFVVKLGCGFILWRVNCDSFEHLFVWIIYNGMWLELEMMFMLDDGTCVMKKVLFQNNEQLELVRKICGYENWSLNELWFFWTFIFLVYIYGLFDWNCVEDISYLVKKITWMKV